MDTPIADVTKTMKELLLREEFNLPKPGQILQGQVINVSKSNIMVDLGSIGIGIVYPGQFYDNPDRMKTLRPGDKVSALLIELENEDGYRELSLKAAQMTTAWQDIKDRMESGDLIQTQIININKGGLIVEVSGVQGFLPLSQLSSEHYPKVEGGDTTKIVQALQKFKGQEFTVKIIDFNESENKLIVSERAIRDEAARDEIAKYSVGQIVQGQITEVTDFGAFVKLSDNLDALIHSSEIDWKFVDNPKDILSVGQEIEAKIISLDNNKVSLSLKVLKEDPWEKAGSLYSVDQKVTGKVLKIRSSGAFVELPGDIIGILPTTEGSGQPLSEIIEIGKDYEMTVTMFDPADHKLTLSLVK